MNVEVIVVRSYGKTKSETSTYEELSEWRIYQAKRQKDDWSGLGMLQDDRRNMLAERKWTCNHPEECDEDQIHGGRRRWTVLNTAVLER